MEYRSSHLTQAYIHLAHLTHNVCLLQEMAGPCVLWPAIKANAYGHGAEIIARHLVTLGYSHLCVAHVTEAIALLEAGVSATFLVMAATLPEYSDLFAAYDLEAVICTIEMAESLARAAARRGKRLAVHLKVDTGMGRIGIPPHQTVSFLEHCRQLPALVVKGVMSHFACADAADKTSARQQLRLFQQVRAATGPYGIAFYHCANSAALFDLPEARADAARPGIALYGLRPSTTMLHPRVHELKPVLEWKTRITYLKEVPAGTGLSYGHTFHTTQPSLIATLPIGYGDGLGRRLSNRLELLVHGQRCRQVGAICMDQSLLDVTALCGQVKIGDEVVILGQQGQELITAEELAARLDTIPYEVVTAIAGRVPRIAIDAPVT